MSHVALLPAVPPLSEPKPAVPAEASDDPLAELVRVMSAELMGGATPAPGGEAAPASEAVAAEAGVANQLEAKLADDLKALSSAFQSDPPLPAAPAAPTSEPAPSAAEPAPAEAKAESPAAQSLPSTPVAHDGSVSPPSNAEAVPPSPSGLERANGRGWAASRRPSHAAGSSAGASGDFSPGSGRKAGHGRFAAAAQAETIPGKPGRPAGGRAPDDQRVG